jgi:hypothetical protein
MEWFKRKFYYILLQLSFLCIYSYSYTYSIFFRKKRNSQKKIAVFWYNPYGLTGSNLRMGNWKPYFEKENITFDNFYCYTFDEYKNQYEDGVWSEKYLFYIKLLFRRFKQFHKIKDYDVIWVDRGFLPIYPLQKAFFERCIKRLNKILIIDSTDGGDYQNNPRLVIDTMDQADKITVAYKYLYEFYSEKYKDVHWINWTIPKENYIIKKEYSFKEKLPVIGWMGSPDNGVHLENLSSVLEKVATSHPFILRYMCRKPLKINAAHVKIEHCSFENYYETISSFDIGLCPFLTNDMSTKGKIAMKNQEFMLCGIPQVCSPVAISEHLIDNENALIAMSETDWYNKIISLILSENERSKLGQNSKTIFNNYYLYEIEFNKLKEALLT